MPVLFNPILGKYTYASSGYVCKCERVLQAATSHCRLCHLSYPIQDTHMCTEIENTSEEEKEDGLK